MKDWNAYRGMAKADPVAAEKGRLLAAHMILNDPEARERVESAYGVEFCRANYPEAYKSGFLRFLDRIRISITK